MTWIEQLSGSMFEKISVRQYDCPTASIRQATALPPADEFLWHLYDGAARRAHPTSRAISDTDGRTLLVIHQTRLFLSVQHGHRPTRI